MPHPEFVDILRGRRLAQFALLGIADVSVHVDETGEDILAVRVDLAITCCGPTFGIDWRPGVADGFDLNDPVALDDNIYGSIWRRARAVDHRGAPNHQSCKRPFTAMACGRRLNHFSATLKIVCDGFIARRRLDRLPARRNGAEQRKTHTPCEHERHSSAGTSH